MTTLTITNGLVFDGWDPDLKSASILIKDGEISRVGEFEAEGEIVDAGGRVITPGFIDAHFHAYAHSLDGMMNERGLLSYAAAAGSRRLKSALRRGFTTVRDVAGGDIGLARAVEEEVIESPHYLYSGPALSQTGGHGDPRKQELDVCFLHGHLNEIVDGADNVRKAVRQRLRTGAHCIKVMASGGVFSLTDPLSIPQYSAEEITAAVEEAHRTDSYVAAHAYSAQAVRHAVNNGVRSIEHGNLIDQATAELMAENNAFLVPTLVTYDAMHRRGEALGLNPTSLEKNQQVLNAGKNAVQLAYNSGVRVGFGSDLMGDLDDDQLQGVRLQIEASSVLDTLRALTRTNADLIQDDKRGRVTAGAVADLIIHPEDPFRTPDILWHEATDRVVIKKGRPISHH